MLRPGAARRLLRAKRGDSDVQPGDDSEPVGTRRVADAAPLDPEDPPRRKRRQPEQTDDQRGGDTKLQFGDAAAFEDAATPETNEDLLGPGFNADSDTIPDKKEDESDNSELKEIRKYTRDSLLAAFNAAANPHPQKKDHAATVKKTAEGRIHAEHKEEIVIDDEDDLRIFHKSGPIERFTKGYSSRFDTGVKIKMRKFVDAPNLGEDIEVSIQQHITQAEVTDAAGNKTEEARVHVSMTAMPDDNSPLAKFGVRQSADFFMQTMSACEGRKVTVLNGNKTERALQYYVGQELNKYGGNISFNMPEEEIEKLKKAAEKLPQELKDQIAERMQYHVVQIDRFTRYSNPASPS